jgi:hypothetical protein
LPELLPKLWLIASYPVWRRKWRDNNTLLQNVKNILDKDDSQRDKYYHTRELLVSSASKPKAINHDYMSDIFLVSLHLIG